MFVVRKLCVLDTATSKTAAERVAATSLVIQKECGKEGLVFALPPPTTIVRSKKQSKIVDKARMHFLHAKNAFWGASIAPSSYTMIAIDVEAWGQDLSVITELGVAKVSSDQVFNIKHNNPIHSSHYLIQDYRDGISAGHHVLVGHSIQNDISCLSTMVVHISPEVAVIDLA